MMYLSAGSIRFYRLGIIAHGKACAICVGGIDVELCESIYWEDVNG